MGLVREREKAVVSMGRTVPWGVLVGVNDQLPLVLGKVTVNLILAAELGTTPKTIAAARLFNSLHADRLPQIRRGLEGKLELGE